jgi:hypothetical protein
MDFFQGNQGLFTLPAGDGGVSYETRKRKAKKGYTLQGKCRLVWGKAISCTARRGRTF